MKQKDSHIASLIRDRIKSVDPNAQGIIFGSRARGDARKDSDWDILILTDYPVTMKVEDDFRDKLFDLELEISQVLSIFIYQKSDWNTRHKVTPLYANIKKEGVLL
ncbi:MAG TPA: nucleotidyltransferase domain-containing protein [Bacteroidales bacterium]|jgi:predicted nucleotidyltransferase|nr:nucleotidyltransferase domain-containing protein [Bacteroidales bacterium]